MGRMIDVVGEWALVAPHREVPPDEAVQPVAMAISSEECRYVGARPVLDPHDPVGSLKGLLSRLTPLGNYLGRVYADQFDGVWVVRGPTTWYRMAAVSVLAVAVVHGEKTVYVVRHEMWEGRPRLLRAQLLASLTHHLEVERELRVIEDGIIRQYPPLTALQGVESRPYIVDALPQGHVVFLTTHLNDVRYILLGGALLPVSPPYDSWRLRGHLVDKYERGTPGYKRDIAALAEALRRRTRLGILPPRVVRALLCGEGNVSQVERALAGEVIWDE